MPMGRGRQRTEENGAIFLEARVVGRDALCKHEIPISRLEPVQRHFLSRVLKERASEVLAVIGRIETRTMCLLSKGLCRRCPAAVSTAELSNTRPTRASEAMWRK